MTRNISCKRLMETPQFHRYPRWTLKQDDGIKPPLATVCQAARNEKLLRRFFTWWNGQTFGTQLWTWRYGEFVGDDEFAIDITAPKMGKIDAALGFERRWLI